MDVAADEVRQLVRVLADGGDLDRSGPVEVEVAHHVREELHLVWLEAGVILKKVISSRWLNWETTKGQIRPYLDDVVGGWVDGALANVLRYDEEIVPLRKGDAVVNDRTGGRVAVVRALHGVEPAVDPLVDDDEGELRRHLQIREDLPDACDLSLLHVADLPLANAVAVDDNLVRNSPVVFLLVTEIVGEKLKLRGMYSIS